MTTAQIASLLEPKNQNLPELTLQDNFKNLTHIFVPVVEGEEKKVKTQFKFLKSDKLSGKKGESLEKIQNNQLYVFVGMGSEKMVNSRNMRRFYGMMYLAAAGSKPKNIGMACDPDFVKEAATGIHVAALNSKQMGQKKAKNKSPKVTLVSKSFKTKISAAKKDLKEGQTLAESKNMMRILGSLPPNELNPQKYADLIQLLARKWKVKCERISRSKLKDYNLLNAVSAGSQHNSELLVITMHPKKGKTKKATAYVGKGLCYDSGGLQSKANYMKNMKEDMAGSASVLATVYNIKKSNLPLKETTYFVLALAENMMGCNAMRADDIYVAGDGQTVEIVHTDAEGRLVLADAICYTKKHYKTVHRYYTIATLTGSCLVGFGDVYTGTVCNDDDLSKKVTEVGKNTGDYVHVGPWDMEYDDNNSALADVANLGENQRDAGWIKAGLFLYRFVPKAKKEKDQAKFCHFDIAGSIDMDEKGKPWRKKGFSSGVGVALMSDLLTK